MQEPSMSSELLGFVAIVLMVVLIRWAGRGLGGWKKRVRR